MMTTGGEGTVGAVRLIKKNKFARKLNEDKDDDDEVQQYLRIMKAINHS